MRWILTINTGSSSLKAALYEVGEAATRKLSGRFERIGLPGGRVRLISGAGAVLIDQHVDLRDHGAALNIMLTWLRDHCPDLKLDAAGHRVVHGGIRFQEPQHITPEMVAILQGFVSLDPDHMPQAIQAIQAAIRAYPDLPQVACFDTAFHRRMPRVAQMYPLPGYLFDEGMIRFGFHGLSYEYITQELQSIAPQEARGRVIIAHLGNGASLAAVHDGIGIDTTMGFTPAGGLMMGTRSGDIDPGVLLSLLSDRGMTPTAVNELINRQSGLLGISGTSGDMQDLLEIEAADPRAADAVDLFCYQARKYIGAMAAALDGLDCLVFTGGIGENASAVRARICDGLSFLGIEVETSRNTGHASVISSNSSRTTVRVIRTDEELMIVRSVARVLRMGGTGDGII